MALKNMLSDGNYDGLTSNSSDLVALDTINIQSIFRWDKNYLDEIKSHRQIVYSTNVNLSKTEKTKMLVVEDPEFDNYNRVSNVFGIPSRSYVQLYYVIRFGICIIDKGGQDNNWSNYNYYMNQSRNVKPKILILFPRYYYENKGEFLEEIKTIDFFEKDTVYTLNNELYPIIVHLLKHCDWDNYPFWKNDSFPDYKEALSNALRTIAIAKLIKKYAKSENYHPLMLPEHKTYLDNLLSLDALYQETFVNLSKLTQYLWEEMVNMDNEMIEEYKHKIESIGTKVDCFINDYNNITGDIIKFNESLDRDKTKQKHKNFLSQFE